MTTNARNFPKILFVNYYRPDSQILADLIRQLFLGYPVEKIAWWYCHETPIYAKPDLLAGSLHRFPLPARLMPNRRLTAAKSLLMERIWRPLAARHLQRTVADVKPDVVWVLLNGWPAIAATAVDWRGMRLHVSLWDYLDLNAGKSSLGPARARRLMDKIFQLVGRADTYDTLCPSSVEEIRRQTGKTGGLIVHSGFEPVHLQALENHSVGGGKNDDVLRIAYVGTIISEKGFFRTLGALEKIRATQPRKVVLEFFGARNYSKRPWFKPDWMVEHGLFTDQGLVDALRQCSWGIVVMDPDGEDLQYNRFSFPNKVGTCLSAGVPVLGFGHPQSCLAVMMGEHHFGRFTSATDAAVLEKFLLESFSMASPREFFRQGILQCAQTEFDAAAMRARVWQTLGVS